MGSVVPVYISKNPDFRLPDDPAVPIIMVGPGTGLAPFRSFILQRMLEHKLGRPAPGPMHLYFGCRRRDQVNTLSVVGLTTLGAWFTVAFVTWAGAFCMATRMGVCLSHAVVVKGNQRQSHVAETAFVCGVSKQAVLMLCCVLQDYLYGSDLERWASDSVITLHTAFSREAVRKVYVQHKLRETGAQVWQMLQAGGYFYVCGDATSMAGAVEQALLDIIQEHMEEGSADKAQHYLQQLSEAGRYERDVWF